MVLSSYSVCASVQLFIYFLGATFYKNAKMRLPKGERVVSPTTREAAPQNRKQNDGKSRSKKTGPKEFSLDDIAKMRELHRVGLSLAKIGKLYGISRYHAQMAMGNTIASTTMTHPRDRKNVLVIDSYGNMDTSPRYCLQPTAISAGEQT